MPKVSVIVACYNQGLYLDEAVQSVLEQTYQDFEVIVVDDGSSDKNTLQILDCYQRPKTRIIRGANQGLPSARNTGIDLAVGKYILPLDADDRIDPTYLAKAVRALDSNEKIGIVYSEADFFGDAGGHWELPSYQFPAILYGNMIFSSAFFHKSDWVMANGYDPKLIYGWEDYDLWLTLIASGREVFCIPETLFFYRRSCNSMVAKMTREQVIFSYHYLFKKHQQLYEDNIGMLLADLHDYRQRVADLEASLADLEASLLAVQASASWRITKPLRYAKGLARRVFGGQVPLDRPSVKLSKYCLHMPEK